MLNPRAIKTIEDAKNIINERNLTLCFISLSRLRQTYPKKPVFHNYFVFINF